MMRMQVRAESRVAEDFAEAIAKSAETEDKERHVI